MLTTAPRRYSLVLSAILAFAPALPAQAPEDVVPDAGTFFYDGGAVIAKRARTSTTATVFAVNNIWQNLPNGILQYNVGAGNTRLFNITFNGECVKPGGGELRIRVVDTVGVSPVEPNDGERIFCSSGGRAMHTAIWVKNAGPGLHTLRVQFLKEPGGNATIDDWTFELVVHTNP